jgi:hypothetical protein
MEGQAHATAPTIRLPETTRRQSHQRRQVHRAPHPARVRFAQNARKHGFTASTFAVEEFDRLKALRQELPDEPIFDPQPEPKETT